MQCGINNIKDLGCFDRCQDIVLPIPVKQEGVHTIVYFRGANTFKYESLQFKGSDFKIANKLPAGVSRFRIIQPDGTFYRLSDLDLMGFIQESIKECECKCFWDGFKLNNTTSEYLPTCPTPVLFSTDCCGCEEVIEDEEVPCLED